MRAAIYARYSSDLQSDSSIDDQLRLCRERAVALGHEVADIYCDAALSGAHLASRPAIQRLMADARAGRFDLILTEALDRLSRDQEDIAGIYKRLSHLRIPIVTLSEGEVSELHIGLKGTMNALFLKDLAAKVRRGQRGRAEIGRAPGGLTYGYRVVRELGPDGEPVRGKRAIDEDAAAVIRRIFDAYAAGVGPRQIAYDLNADGIPSPRRGHWNASSIIGSRARATGILHNELYIGRLTYARQTFRKDPDTGKRVPTLNDRGAWISHEVPELRIVAQDVWDRVQALKQTYGRQSTGNRRRPRHLLSGLLRCGCCDASMIVVTKARIGCAGYRESRICHNGRTIELARVEERVLDAVKAELLRPEAVAEFMTTYRAAWEEDAGDLRRARSRLERAIADTDARIARIVAAIAEGTNGKAMRGHLAVLEEKAAELAAERARSADPSVIALHPHLPDLYRRQVDNLAACLNDPQQRAEATALLAQIVERIDLHPSEIDTGYEIEVFGRLACLMEPNGRRSAAVRNRTSAVVAPEGSMRQSPPPAWSVRVRL